MTDNHRILPALATITGLTWMAAVLLISANHKGVDPAGDIAYDWSNRAHTLALLLLLGTVVVIHRTIRSRRLTGERAALALIVAAGLMLAGNVLAFWGALLTDGSAEEFWGGLAGWLMFLPGTMLMLGGFIALALAARTWTGVSVARRWSIGAVGVLLTITTITWAGSPVLTLGPALLAAFALLATGTAVAQAEPEPALPASQPISTHAP